MNNILCNWVYDYWNYWEFIFNNRIKKYKVSLEFKTIKAIFEKNKAIVLSISQFVIPFVLAIYISDFIFGILNNTNYFIVPISIIVLGIAYINIRSTLPYKITKREKIIHGMVLVIGIVIFVFMLFEYKDDIIEKFGWLTVK